jgi:hypothetical protein
MMISNYKELVAHESYDLQLLSNEIFASYYFYYCCIAEINTHLLFT